MKWIAENYQLLLVAVGVVINVLNAVTKSYQNRKPGLAKFMLWLVEKVSVLQSRDAPGWLKPPLVSVAPEKPPTVEEAHTPQLIVGENKNVS